MFRILLTQILIIASFSYTTNATITLGKTCSYLGMLGKRNGKELNNAHLMLVIIVISYTCVYSERRGKNQWILLLSLHLFILTAVALHVARPGLPPPHQVGGVGALAAQSGAQPVLCRHPRRQCRHYPRHHGLLHLLWPSSEQGRRQPERTNSTPKMNQDIMNDDYKMFKQSLMEIRVILSV